jgi:hypothetical protein
MKILRNLTALLVTAGVVAGCATARIVEQTTAPGTHGAIRNAVVIVDPPSVRNPTERGLSDVYFRSFASSLEQTFGADGVPVVVVFGKPDSAAARAAVASMKPSHILRFSTDRTTSDYGTLVRGHWLLDVLAEVGSDPDAGQNQVPPGTPHLHRFEAVYNASVNANTCYANDPPASRVQRCGRIFADKVTDKLTALHLLDRSAPGGAGAPTAPLGIPAPIAPVPVPVTAVPVQAPASTASRLPAASPTIASTRAVTVTRPAVAASAITTTSSAVPSDAVPARLSEENWAPSKP